MLQPKTCTALVVALALAAGPLHAQKQDEQHHPASASAATPCTMMSGGMAMTGMARMMFGQEGMGGMMAAMTEHVEGRLAFLKTELKITDAQLPLWNAFAEAARGNAKAIEGGRSALRGTQQRAEEDRRYPGTQSNGYDDVIIVRAAILIKRRLDHRFTS